MKVAKDRPANFKDYSLCQDYQFNIRHIVEQTLCAPDNPASIKYIIKHYQKFLAKTKVDQRIKY